MFVNDGHLCVGHVQLDRTASEFCTALLSSDGFTLSERDEYNIILQGVLPVFGECLIKVPLSEEMQGYALVRTIKKVSEEEMLPMLDYMKRSLPIKPHYDDHGYGVKPKPNEVELIWELQQGQVCMSWDGFNYGRGRDANTPLGDGTDIVCITLRDCTLVNRVRDEDYWQSEVD